MTHTPGPWTLKIGDSDHRFVRVSGHWDEKVHYLYSVGTYKDFEREIANARLIAAAPELLEAMKEAKNGLRYWEPQTAYGASERARICALVDAAITKATGVDQ